MEKAEQPAEKQKADKTAYGFVVISPKMLELANLGIPKGEFMKEIAGMLVEFSGCDYLEIRAVREDKLYRCLAPTGKSDSIEVSFVPYNADKHDIIAPGLDINADSDFEHLCRDVASGKVDTALPYFTRRGSLWIDDTSIPLELSSETCKWAGGRTIHLGNEFKSLFVMRFEIERNNFGLLILKGKPPGFFSKDLIKSIEDIAYILGISFAHRLAQAELRERVKELTCLYGIAKVASEPESSLELILEETVKLLPPGWLYPQMATARIILNGNSYSTPGFKDDLQKLSSDIIADGKKRGIIEVAYTEKMPEMDEGPFLKEERSLIDAIATEIGLIIEHRHVEQEKEKLQEQLRHADRLATLGQLSAGVAHELNEPLGNILGFAQLVRKNPDMPEQIAKDIEKIEGASLHAREVVRKLMLFARQSPQQKNSVNLSELVKEGLYFFESRCAKAGIELIKELTEGLPNIIADKSQLHQVMINLIVNAIQAIPDKGRITIRTGADKNDVFLSVEDTGIGMTEEIQKNIFIPFFTTKDINEGTGLGLAVVHGIVTSHGGSISVNSQLGQGSCFKIKLPYQRQTPLNSSEEEKNGRK